MGYEWFVATRYLRGVHQGRVRICTAGVTIGVAVLIAVTSVMNGFERDFLGKMLRAYGHLRLFHFSSDRLPVDLTGYEDWIQRFESQPGVAGVAPAIEQFALISAPPTQFRPASSQEAMVRGIDPDYDLLVHGIEDYLFLGDWEDLSSDRGVSAATETVAFDPFEIDPTTPAVFLGIEMAKSLFKAPAFLEGDKQLSRFLNREVIGKDITLMVPKLTRGPSGLQPEFFSVRVKGIYRTGFYDFDYRYALTSLSTARILKQMPVDPPGVQFLEVKLDKPNDADRIGLALALWAEREHDSAFVPMAWTELNPVLLEAVKLEKVVMAAILTLVVLVAAFGISSTLVMTVIEKTREIGTLMALGTRRFSIMAIFVINGFLVGLFGVIAGTLAGVGICAVIDLLRIRMPGGGEVYVLEYLPVEIRGMDVLVIVLFSLLASTLAGVYPAWKASRLHPVEALGHE